MSSWVTTPSQLFSYYPKYEYLDNLLSTTNRKTVKLYIDFKSCAQALFQEWAVKYIIDQSRGTEMVDTSLFAAVLEFISFHKLYARKRNIHIDLYFFMESGTSSYHQEIYKDYKSNRAISDFFGLDDETRKFFFKILDKNYTVCERVINRLPNCYFFRLRYLEADFLPWYLMKYSLPKQDVEDSLNIIYSTDKDMHQCLDAPNIYQFSRHYKNTKMVSYQNIYSSWLKNDIPMNNPADWFPLVLSIIGDDGDGFSGVKGIGIKTMQENFEYIRDMCGFSMTNVYDNITNKRPIFRKDFKPASNALQKIMDHETIIIRNLKLSSYHLISEYMNGGYPVDMIEKKKIINECVSSTEKWSNAIVLNQALTKAGLLGIVNDLTMNNLFMR